MTLWDTVLALVRRWPIVLLGAVITAGIGLIAIREQGVYFTRTQVVFLVPSAWSRNVLQVTPEDVIVTASAVSKRVIGAGTVVKYGSLDATIVGTSSVREGVWIRAEDQGGQWAPDFRAPIIIVDIVAPTVTRVRELQEEAIGRIRKELDVLQSEVDAAPRYLITMEVASNETVVYHVRGNRTRALGMVAVLGGAGTLAVVWVLESRRRRVAGGE